MGKKVKGESAGTNGVAKTKSLKKLMKQKSKKDKSKKDKSIEKSDRKTSTATASELKEYDVTTNMKLLGPVLAGFDIGAVEEWCQKLIRAFLKTPEEDVDESIDSTRSGYVRQLSSFFRTRQIFASPELQQTVLKFLFLHANFDIVAATKDVEGCKKMPTAPVTEVLREQLHQSFRKAFECSCKVGSTTTKGRIGHEFEELKSLKSYALKLLDNSNVSCVNKRLSLVYDEMKIASSKLTKRKLPEDLHLLFEYLHGLVWLLAFEHPEQASSALDELTACSKHASQSAKQEKSDGSTPFWADVLTDLTISFLPMCGRECASLFLSAYTLFASKITRESICLLHDALLATSLDEDGKSTIGDEDTSDVESDADENDVESEEEGSEFSDKHQQFKNNVFIALGGAAPVSNLEEEVALGDEEMFQFDEALADVFRTKFKVSQDEATAKRSLVEFKNRCCDLVQQLLNKGSPSLAHVLQIVPCLVALTRNINDSKAETIALGQKAVRLLMVIAKMKHLKHDEDCEESVEKLDQLLTTVLGLCQKFPRGEMQKPLARICAWIVMTSKEISPSSQFYVERFSGALNDFFMKPTSHFSSDVFLQVMAVDENLTRTLVKVLELHIFKGEIRVYQKASGLSLLVAGLKYFQRQSNSSGNGLAIDLESKVISALNQHLSSENSVKAIYLSELLQVLVILRKNVELAPDCELRAKLLNLKKSVRKSLGNGKNALNKLARLEPTKSEGKPNKKERKRKSEDNKLASLPSKVTLKSDDPTTAQKEKRIKKQKT